jgi:hypothetical protein
VSAISIERLLDKIESDISSLIFAGVLDNNAKLLSFRRGKAGFSLPIERHDTLDVQLSLMFSLIRQLEDICGTHELTASRFAKQGVFLFGTNELHIFVITSPASDGQVATKLSELVVTMGGIEPSVTSPMGTSRVSDQSVAPMMTPPRREHINGSQMLQSPLPRREAIAMLQGYLMALDVDCTIQEDVGEFCKVKVNSRENRISWQMLEKVKSAFKDKVDMHQIGADADGRVFVTISFK